MPTRSHVIFSAAPEVAFDLPEARGVEDLLFAEFGARTDFLDRLHGSPHWLSVFDNARRLAASLPDGSLSSIQTTMTLLAAFLHDTGRCIPRRGDYAALHHSLRSAKFIRDRLPSLDLDLSPAEIETVARLARGHYRVFEGAYDFANQWKWADAVEPRLCLQIGRDADALDRVRFAGLDPSYLHLRDHSRALIPYVTRKWNGDYRVKNSHMNAGIHSE